MGDEDSGEPGKDICILAQRKWRGIEKLQIGEATWLLVMRKFRANSTESKSCILLITVFYPWELAWLLAFRRDSKDICYLELNNWQLWHGMKLIHYQAIRKGYEVSPAFAAQDKFLAQSCPLLTIHHRNVSLPNWCIYRYPGFQGALLTVGFYFTCFPSPPSAVVTGVWSG